MSKKQTPLMQQYFEIKAEYADAIVLFQVGDFYELFYDDARKAAECLAIALTARGTDEHGQPIPLCGVPIHAAQHYIARLVKAGYHVALCNQLETPQPGKVVKRGVVQVLTPGTLTDSHLLDDKHASYLFSFFPMASGMGVVCAELLTAQLHATLLPADEVKALETELARFLPDEILVPHTQEGKGYAQFFMRSGFTATHASFFEHDSLDVRTWLTNQFKPHEAEPFTHSQPLFCAMHNMYGYLKKNQEPALSQLRHINFYEPDDFLMLDTVTQRNLELVRNLQDGSVKNTLFSLLDKAITPMGSRTIARWIMRPLMDEAHIVARQDAIAQLLDTVAMYHHLKQSLQKIGDVERVIGRIALARASLSDYRALLRFLEEVPHIKAHLFNFSSSLIRLLHDYCAECSDLTALLRAAMSDALEVDWIIKEGFDQELDRMRSLVMDSQSLILALERQEQEATGINTLKIRYNSIQGYFIEITKSHLDRIPDRFERLQTLVGKERYTTPELKRLHADITHANQQVSVREAELFDDIKREVVRHISKLRKTAHAVAQLDALLALRSAAYEGGYIRPTFNTHNSLTIKGGRHPVVEHILGSGFVPNDLHLEDARSLLLITGPNMGGKSTYLRQTALIVIMAQIGSFVPAESADIALRDRIFTRIGASDNVAAGKSTFLVEMEETAAICRFATAQSLIILDEVGRGTSTYDGMVLAQAIVEYLVKAVKARALFATHYHELTALSNELPMIVPCYAASRKGSQGIVFLHTIKQGVADGSFGIEVAKLAQLPTSIIHRAEELLAVIGKNSLHYSTMQPATQAQQSQESDNSNISSSEITRLQEEIFALNEQLKRYQTLEKKVKALNINELSPKQAFDVLWHWHEEIL